MLCQLILLYANPRMPIKIGGSRLALINSVGCDLCCILKTYCFLKCNIKREARTPINCMEQIKTIHPRLNSDGWIFYLNLINHFKYLMMKGRISLFSWLNYKYCKCIWFHCWTWSRVISCFLRSRTKFCS